MRLVDKPKKQVDWSLIMGDHGCKPVGAGAGSLNLILTKECMGQRTFSQSSLGDMVISIKARPALPLP